MAIKKTYIISLTFGSNVDSANTELIIERLLADEFISFAKGCPEEYMDKEESQAIADAFQAHGEVSVEWEDDEEVEDVG